MALRDIVKISRKTFFNPAGWLDYQFLKEQNRTIFAVLKATMTADKPTREETFEQAMERLNLTEADVIANTKLYRKYALLFAICGILVFFYAFYLLFTGSITGWILGIASSALFLSQAFKFDFWSLQLRERKLGMTIEEWKQSLLGNKGPRA